MKIKLVVMKSNLIPARINLIPAVSNQILTKVRLLFTILKAMAVKTSIGNLRYLSRRFTLLF
jgi:hypothetical protein